jgi:MFS family permease
MGVPAGLLLSTLVFAAFARLPTEEFMAWGWRVPFLASIVLVGVGLVIRLRILETPAFERVKETQVEARLPLIEVLTRYPKQVLLAAGTRIAENGAFYIYSVYVLTYATQQVKLERSQVLDCLSWAAAAEVLAIPVFGALSDRFGRRPVYLFGAIVTALFAYPLFRILDTGDPLLITIALAVALVFSHAAMYAPQAALFAELFATRVRYSGASLGSQLASVIAGGLSPFIATALFKLYGTPALVAYLVAMAGITILALQLLTETAHSDVINST